MSRPDLLFFGFCFLFVTLGGSVKCMFGLFMQSILYIYSFCVGASGRFCAPLSVPAQSAGTPPPQGEASVPASIAAKFVVSQSRRNVYLTTKYLSIYGRSLGSPCGGAGAKRLRGGNKKAPVSGRWHVCIFFVKKKILPPSQKVSSPFGSRVISWWTASAGLMPWLTMAFTVRTMGMSTW